MHKALVELTLKEKDKNVDGRIDFDEFIGSYGIFSIYITRVSLHDF